MNGGRRENRSESRERGRPVGRRGFVGSGLAVVALPAAIGLGTPGRARAQGETATPIAGSQGSGTDMPQSGYAPVNGLELYYEVHGTGDPLVLLHGGFGTIDAMFGGIIPGLTADRQVIAVELQAHGHTADIDRPMTYEAMADDIAGLLDHLGLERADVLGYSLGGGVAWQLAIRHPEKIRKLIVVSAPVRRDGWYPVTLEGMASVTPEVLLETPIYDAYAAANPRPEDFPRLVSKVVALLGEDYDWSQEIAALTAPTMIVVGDADSIRPEHVNELFALRGGGVAGDFGPLSAARLLVLPGAAHSLVMTQIDLVLPAITAFLDAPMPDAA